MTDAHRQLVRRLFPSLACVTFRPVGTGWACDTYLLDDAWIVQLPRTEQAAEKLRTQMRVLPELAREVSAPIPLPELVSYQPAAMAYRRIEGDPCEGTEGIWPGRLGRFLYDLHAVPPEFVGLRARGADDVRVEVRAEASRLRALVDQLLSVDERSRADRAMARYLDDDDLWRFAPCLTHGDLGPEHVLVTGSGDLAGVIDWEEASVGDPAWDFAWWLHERPHVAERALAAYGGASDAGFLRRARGAYVLMPWHEVAYGLTDGPDASVGTGLEGVRRRLG